MEKKKHHPGSKGTDTMNTMTKAELMEQRKDIIETTRNMIGAGWTYGMKVTGLATRYNISERQAKKYIAYTRDDIKKRKQENYEKEFDEVLIKLEAVYRESYATGKFADAMKALNQLITLRGYEAPKKLMVAAEVKVKTDLSHLTPEELIQIQNMLAKNNNE